MIVSIYLSKKSGETLQSVVSAEVSEGAGIVGDRNFGRRDYPGQNVTFIEAEAVARYNSACAQAIEAVSTRRNIVTAGVDLNALVGVDFYIGAAGFRGIEFCTPCATLGEVLQNESISGAEVVKAFLTSGGLRADVISSGTIAVGMALQPFANR